MGMILWHRWFGTACGVAGAIIVAFNLVAFNLGLVGGGQMNI